jgi:hypothetical protein
MGKVRFIQGFDGKMMEAGHLEDTGIERRIILK